MAIVSKAVMAQSTRFHHIPFINSNFGQETVRQAVSLLEAEENHQQTKGEHGHVPITHKMLASIIQVFCALSLIQFVKKVWNHCAKHF